ncbi:MAG: chorismate synthase [Clostridia bacterium]|nr:chorismate synthase [Clostridia bacterium]
MKNTFGIALTLTIFGESHGEYIGAVLDGLAPGIKIDREYINARLAERRPSGKISTARVEADEYIIASGEFEGYTTGAPLTVLIPNTNKKSKDYSTLKTTPRPSHADYTAECKYHGFQDYRGGGHFSGRITAALVAAGAILRSALISKGIKIGSHIVELHGASDRRFEDYERDIDSLLGKSFPTLTDSAEENMRREAEKAAAMGDSVGGILETAIIGVPAGVGEPWFDTLESMLAHALFSVPAVKGVEFGAGFAFADMYGSEANDPFTIKDGGVVTVTNNNGGINGGITNGMPILLSTVIKPTPSIFKEQATVDLTEGKNTVLKLEGRHDPCIIHRARAVVDAMCAIVIADMLTARFGTDYLASGDKK